MILQLLQTIGIAISISTSVNNANFEHKERRNATYPLMVNIEENFEQKGSVYTYTEGVMNRRMQKWMMTNSYDNGGYYNENFLIMNTAYTTKAVSTDPNRQNQNGYYQVAIFSITNYYNTTVSLNLHSIMTTSGGIYNTAYMTSYRLQKKYTYADSSSLFNMTLNQSTISTVQQFMDANQIEISNTNNLNDSAPNVDQEITNFTVNSSETITFFFVIDLWNTVAGAGQYVDSAGPNKLLLSIVAQIPERSTEVIDVPGMMFTIMTMPFSFISQAFNLTVFPGTPYQINFSNLFLTLISVFFLLWILKHIFGGR